MTERLDVTSKDNYRRVVYDDAVNWYIDTADGPREYCVARFPFVPNYHLCDFINDEEEFVTERPMQQFKTLSEALAVLRVLETSTRNSND